MKNHLLLLIFSILLATSTGGCHSGRNDSGREQGTQIPLEYLPALNGDYFKLNSNIVGRPYHIYVRFPEGYDDTQNKSYPVVYLLDGDSMFPILAGNHLFLHYDDKIPEAVVVGIAYGSFDPEINKRGLDFSTPTADDDENRGGAKNFHRFMEQELLPEVEKKYPVDPKKRILFGQSRGGYMVLYSAFTKPDLFWGRIASNPTFRPGREQFYEAPAQSSREDLTLVVTSGSNEHYPGLRESALAWYKDWKERSETPWSIAFATIRGGTHAASSVDSYRLGMNRLFEKEVQASRQKPDN